MFILDHPMISLAEIAALQGMQLASVERYLRELCTLGCLDLVDTRRYQQEICQRVPDREGYVVQADIGQRWQLSACGMRLLAAAYHFNVHTIALLEGSASGEQALVVSHQGESWSNGSLSACCGGEEWSIILASMVSSPIFAGQHNTNVSGGIGISFSGGRWAPSSNGVTIVKIACTTCIQMLWRPTW